MKEMYCLVVFAMYPYLTNGDILKCETK